MACLFSNWHAFARSSCVCACMCARFLWLARLRAMTRTPPASGRPAARSAARSLQAVGGGRFAGATCLPCPAGGLPGRALGCARLAHNLAVRRAGLRLACATPTTIKQPRRQQIIKTNIGTFRQLRLRLRLRFSLWRSLSLPLSAFRFPLSAFAFRFSPFSFRLSIRRRPC